MWSLVNKRFGSISSSNSKTKPRTRTSQSAFGYQALEKRQLLAGDFVFAASAGSAGTDVALDVATDRDGSVFSVGFFNGTVDFDPGVGADELMSAGRNDIYITKLTDRGELAWAHRIGGSGLDRATAVAVDRDGNVLVTGTFAGRDANNTSFGVDFDPGPGSHELRPSGGTSTINAFVLQLNNDGDFVWASKLEGDGTIRPNAIAADGMGNVITTGSFTNRFDFDPGAPGNILTSTGDTDAYVSKLDPNGAFVWAKQLGGSESVIGYDVAIDDSGMVYTVGAFQGTADFNPGGGVSNRTSVGDFDIYISSLTSDGDLRSIKAIGGTGEDRARGIALDQNGGLYATGEFADQVNVPLSGIMVTQLVSQGPKSAFVVKASRTTGDFVWANEITGPNAEVEGTGIAVDSFRNVYTTGQFSGTADFDAGPNESNQTSRGGTSDTFLTRLNREGEFVWVNQLSGESGVNGFSIAIDDTENVVLAGAFQGSADFDPGPLVAGRLSNGSTDAFVMKLTQDLIVQFPAGDDLNSYQLRRADELLQVVDLEDDSIVASAHLDCLMAVRFFGNENESEALEINFEEGGFFRLPNRIHFSGMSGTGDDVLSIIGDGTTNGLYLPGGLGAVPLFHANGAGQSTIQFSGLDSAILVSKMANLTVRTMAGTDHLALTNAVGLDATPHTRVQGLSSGTRITPLAFADVPNFTLDTGDGDTPIDNDFINVVDNALSARGMKFATVTTGNGNDRLVSQLTDYRLPGGGVLRFVGGAGVDTLEVIADVEALFLRSDALANRGRGFLFFDAVESASLNGGAGVNRIQNGSFVGGVRISGLGGDDVLIGGAVRETILGGTGNDFILGGDNADRLFGGPGADTVLGQGGADLLNGFTGNDDLRGGEGGDFIVGGEGNDVLQGGGGEDYLAGDEGDDRLDGGIGNDVMRGGVGADQFKFTGTASPDRLVLRRVDANRLFMFRELVGSSERLERDDAFYDTLDRVFMPSLGGDDLFNIDLMIGIDGVLDGGLGTNFCSAPDSWVKLNC